MIKRYNYINTAEVNYPIEGRDIIIWGRGDSALSLYIKLVSQRANVIGFVDSFVRADEYKYYAGKKLFTLKELKDIEGIIIYIATEVQKYRIEIMESLEEFNSPTILCKGTIYGPVQYDVESMYNLIEKNNKVIASVRENLSDAYSTKTYNNLVQYRTTNQWKLIRDIYEDGHAQYFAPDIVKCSNDEVFVDAGGYRGETSIQFAQYVGDMYNKIYILEPDEMMYQICVEYVGSRKMHDVEFVNKGAWSKTDELYFHNNASLGSSAIRGDGESIISTISIDELLMGERASFVKLDIEGAESEALLGMDYTIRQYHPKLAVSIYHKPEDLWKIPYDLMSKYPFYKFYIRHYTLMTTETVLYAV